MIDFFKTVSLSWKYISPFKVTIDAGTENEYPRCQELIRKLIGDPPRKLRAAKPDELTEEQESKVYHDLNRQGSTFDNTLNAILYFRP